jgi:hypothetical protein
MNQDAPKPLDLLGDPRLLRAFWLRQLSRAVDDQLRSAAFLHWLWCSLTTMTKVQALQSTTSDLMSAWVRPALPRRSGALPSPTPHR